MIKYDDSKEQTRELAQSNVVNLTTNQLKELFELFLKEKGFAVEARKINNIIPCTSSRTTSPSSSLSGNALSSDDSEVSDAIIRGLDDDASEFQLVKPRKIKNQKTRHQRVSKTDSDDIETEPMQRVPSRSRQQQDDQQYSTTPQNEATPPVYLRNETKWSAISSACDRRHKDIFLKLLKVWGLSGNTVEAPYKRGGPRQCHRCQQYGYAATHCHAQLKCVKCTVPRWMK
ncbi:hypothetical protein EVAR_3869_1 [Eumeta japonica]|uniref:Nucleic-acid-binding protein from transposon X-element n=1 Tax=Eumeta variegata TaxID=151549 RepID=A0A4C1STF4_EUMVA|nr:hypothetical protein EVAR_3869_1 [Eumeta japonica]